ncbi:GDP-perosamine synthase [Gammaproteobacteria bacterium]
MAIIPVYEPNITENDIEQIGWAARSGWVSSLGEFIIQFEEAFARFCQTQFALTVSNGTAALHLALISLDIGEGDEVIIPDLTFVATANAVTYTGARVVPVEIDPDTLCLSPVAFEAAITSRTKAVIPVHLYGHPAEMVAICAIAGHYGIRVIEDAAEAHGAEAHGRRVGSFGDFGAFSFYANKLITTGEGGMLTTNDPVLYERAKFLRDHAMSRNRRYWHTEVGYNYRITNLQAALGCSQLQRIDQILRSKREVFTSYYSQLASLPGISLNRCALWANSVYWMVNVEHQEWNEASRDNIMAQLKQFGVDSRPYFYPISDLPMYQDTSVATPIAHSISKRGINLPSSPTLLKSDIDRVCNALRKIIGYP